STVCSSGMSRCVSVHRRPWNRHTVPGYGSHERQEAGMRGYSDDKQALQQRLRRIEGQVRGLQRMVDEDVYCIDILTQISAATKALETVAVGLVEDHLGHCVRDA